MGLGVMFRNAMNVVSRAVISPLFFLFQIFGDDTYRRFVQMVCISYLYY